LKKHRLLLYARLSRHMRSLSFLLGLIVLAIGLYDLFTPILGDYWYWVWIAFGLLCLVWFYYAILMRRGAIQAHPNYLKLQGPLLGVKISYGRFHSATSARLDQHYPYDSLNGREQRLLEPLYSHTCVFIELKSYPPRLKSRRFWFPRFLFGATRPGLICVVDDWMALNRDIEAARSVWQQKYDRRHGSETRSLAAQILDDDIDFR
jgi:Ca2+/Na+ antiporter